MARITCVVCKHRAEYVYHCVDPLMREPDPITRFLNKRQRENRERWNRQGYSMARCEDHRFPKSHDDVIETPREEFENTPREEFEKRLPR